MTASKDSLREQAVWYGFFCLSSVGMQLLNKAIAKDFRERGVQSLDNVLMIWQQVAAIVLNLFCVRAIGGDTWRISRITKEQVVRLLLPSVNFVFMLVCSLKALKTVHVATVVVARNLSTVFVCIGETFLFDKHCSWRAVCCLFVIFCGSLIYGFADLSFEPEGYMWQTANSLLFVIGQLYEKWAMGKSKDQTPLGISTIKNSISVPVLLGMMAFQSEFGQLANLSESGVFDLPRWTWTWIALSGAGTCALSICYMTLYKISSATAITVGGNFNKAITIILASLFFQQAMGYMQTIGLAVCILGSLWYSLEGSAKPAVKKA